MREIKCIKYGDKQQGLDYIPYPGKLGQRIHIEVSQKFWQEWLTYQVMFINENRLSPIKAADRKRIVETMEKFFFDGGIDPVVGYTPE